MTQQNNPGLVPGLMFYMMMKPAPILGPNGEPNYVPVGQTQDFAQAITFANQNPGTVVVLNAVIYATMAAPPLAVPPQPQ